MIITIFKTVGDIIPNDKADLHTGCKELHKLLLVNCGQ